jgi:acetone monooxygenase (methyl acetate-forming)
MAEANTTGARRTGGPGTTEAFDAVVIGAGVAGMYQVYRLREKGFRVRGIEAGSGVGGTWYWNRYPGARVDSQAYIYQYWFSEELNKAWNWSERFPAQPETEAYLNFVADHCDLRKDFDFNTRVTSARFDESTRRWRIETDTGETLDTKYFITCAGMLSAPLSAAFAGQDSFEGQVFHTARWPKEGVALAGKRVGVVGTGATGIQVIQTIAGQAGHLKVFMRTPQYIIPMRNPKYDDADREAHKAGFQAMRQRVQRTFAGFDYDFPERSFHDMTVQERRAVMEEIWADGSLSFWLASFAEMFVDPAVNEEVSEFVREKMRERIKDPALAAKLIPTSYGFGTHRVPLETRYLEAFLRPDVELVDVREAPIECIVPKGVMTADGTVHELDILILATGFDAGTGALTRIDIRGRGGRSLKDDWNADIRTTMGLMVHGYPNLFTTAAPLAPSAALCNMTTCLQQQVDWITDCIQFMEGRGYNVIEPTKAFEDCWVEHHDEVANATLVTKTDSWYMGSNVAGKPRRLLSYIGGVGGYRQKCEDVAARHYEGFSLAG